MSCALNAAARAASLVKRRSRPCPPSLALAANQNGFIELEEFESVLGSLGLLSDLSDEDKASALRTAFAAADTTGEGRVSFDQFVEMFAVGRAPDGKGGAKKHSGGGVRSFFGMSKAKPKAAPSEVPQLSMAPSKDPPPTKDSLEGTRARVASPRTSEVLPETLPVVPIAEVPHRARVESPRTTVEEPGD